MACPTKDLCMFGRNQMTDLTKRVEAIYSLDEKRTQGEWIATTNMDVWIECNDIALAQCGDIDWQGEDGIVQTQEEMESNGRFIAAAPEMVAIIREQQAALELAMDHLVACRVHFKLTGYPEKALMMNDVVTEIVGVLEDE